ncbi:MAG: DUF4148 domain-containing protein [Noviherbaspirillum sp.]
MKARKWAFMAGAVSALAWGVASAEMPGINDADNFFQDFKSTRSRAEVQQDASQARAQYEQRLTGHGEERRAESGVYGPAGSRYSMPEDESSSAGYNSPQMDRVYKDLYFGD